MDELCSNALDPDWLEGKKQEEEERLKNSRESVMTGHPLALGSLFWGASNCLGSHEPWAKFSLPVFAQCFAPVRFSRYLGLTAMRLDIKDVESKEKK